MLQSFLFVFFSNSRSSPTLLYKEIKVVLFKCQKLKGYEYFCPTAGHSSAAFVLQTWSAIAAQTADPVSPVHMFHPKLERQQQEG